MSRRETEVWSEQKTPWTHPGLDPRRTVVSMIWVHETFEKMPGERDMTQ